jgi:uncharacterized protein YecT (DUF1311 family)
MSFWKLALAALVIFGVASPAASQGGPLAIGAPLLLTPRGSETPSFNCARVTTAAARLICADGELARLDGELGVAFQKRKAQIAASDQSKFVADQRAWIRARNTQCDLDGKGNAAIDALASAKPCMMNAIRERIAFLTSTVLTAAPAELVESPIDRSAKNVACEPGPQASTTCISLAVHTRFGDLTVVRSDNKAVAGGIRFIATHFVLTYQGRETKFQMEQGTAFVSLFGVYRVKEGDIVVLQETAGGSGTADTYSVFLAAQDQLSELTPPDFNSSLAGRFGISIIQNGDELDFDLGYEKRRRKRAIYSNGGLSVFVTARMPDDALPTQHCSAVLEMVANCAKTARCNDDIELYGGMGGERYVETLDDMPVFESNRFDKICKTACATRTYNVAEASKTLCGYAAPKPDAQKTREERAGEPRPKTVTALPPQAPPRLENSGYDATSGTAFFVSAKAAELPPKVPPGVNPFDQFNTDSPNYVPRSLALTNRHVVDSCGQIRVRSGAQEGTARVVARDDTNDLALLATDLNPTSTAHWRASVRQGEDIVVYGFPLAGVLAASGNVAAGNVTALAGLGNDERFLQISAPVQPGNSGGPLLDRSGNVVGIVDATLDALKVVSAIGDIPQNVNFAIKASVAAAFLDAHGVAHPEGVGTPPLSTPDIAERAKAITMQVVCVR